MTYDNNAVEVLLDPTVAHNQVYTSYPTANNLLQAYRNEMKSLGIALFVEGSEIRKTILSDEKFARVFELSLEMMEEEVARVNATGRKYIQLKSMYLQNKLFLKFTYSSEEDLDNTNQHYIGISNILEKVAGYIKVDNREYENVLMIAIPAK